MTTTTPPCSNFGSKGQRWNCCLDWRIVKRSSGVIVIVGDCDCGWFSDLVEISFTPVQQQHMHFWCIIISIEILHSGTKVSTVISNLRLCFVFVCWITSAHYSQVLIWSPRFLLAHSSASVGCVSAACGTLKGKRPHLQRNADETDPQKYWQEVGMVRRYILDLLLILFIFSSSEYDQEFNRLRWEEE